MFASRIRGAVAAFVAVVAVSVIGVPAAHAAPITDTGTPSLPDFTGSAAVAKKIPRSHPPQNPFMAANPNSNIHNDTWMTDAYRQSGPLGSNLVATSQSNPAALCGSLAFDSQGRIVSVCPRLGLGPQARIIDPNTLQTISSFDLPGAPDPAGTEQYQNFSGGGYFYLDNKDRIVVPTKTDHIYVLSQGADGNTLTLESDYDLTSVLDASAERITSALPDFKGLIWFVTKQNGKVGTLNTKTGAIAVKRMDEEIENSFAVGEDGVYIVSDKRMYRFKANKRGKPRIIWKATYPNSGIVKPSQVNAGSGTTPTIMDGGYVAIADNDDPMNIVVYRTERKLKKGQKRKVCEQPVFEKGASATENTLLAAGRSIIVENNYGYQDPFGPNSGAPTEPGFARVDMKKNGNACKLRWTNTEARGASVVPKISTGNGLIYTYTRPVDASAQGYYWTALDWRSGKTQWMKYAGSGLSYNNNYAGIAIGPDGTAYLAVTGGILKLSDG